MSKHPSLKFKTTDLKHRNVLKRYERVLLALKKSKEGEIDIFNLPKYKRKRLKGLRKEIKKEEAEKKEEIEVKEEETSK